MELIFPKVKKEEIESAAGLAAEIWRGYFSCIISEEQIEYMLDRFQSPAAIKEQTERQGYEYYWMRRGEEPVGYMAVKPEADTDKLFLSKFYMKQEHRGRGYASLALDWLVRLCRERGHRAIWLTVNRYNETALAVYKKKGFYTVRTQVADIGNGFVMDDFVMEKEIACTN